MINFRNKRHMRIVSTFTLTVSMIIMEMNMKDMILKGVNLKTSKIQDSCKISKIIACMKRRVQIVKLDDLLQ